MRAGTGGPEPGRSPLPAGDPALLPFLQARDEAQAGLLLDDIVARHAEPVARAAVARHLRAAGARPGPPPDAEALSAHVLLILRQRLRDLRRPASAPGDTRLFGELRSFLTAQADDACRGWLRGAFPHRIRLAHRLRYLLARDRRFVLRATPDDEWRCGLSGRDARLFASGEASGPGRRIPEAPHGARPIPARLASDPGALSDRAFDLLTRAGGPVDLEHLVDVLEAEIAAVEPADPAAAPGPAGGRSAFAAAAAADAELAALETSAGADPSAFLRRLWDGIVALPPLQRSAFLLNLRDGEGRGVIALFPIAGIADLRRIAAVLDMTPERLAERWRALPLDDAAIAARLGLTRHQVALLRRAARERLARRLAAAPAGPPAARA
jgi:hypothetical protein